MATGSERSRATLPGPIKRAAAIESGIAYVPVEGSGLAAVDLRTGAVIWGLDAPGHSVSTPAVVDGTLFVSTGVEGSTRYELAAYDVTSLGTGSSPRERWRWRAPSDAQTFVGAVSADTVYATSNDGHVYAIDRSDGTGRTLFGTAGPVGSLATVVDDTLYVASSDRQVYAVDRHSGEQRWTVAVPGAPTIPVVSGGRVIVGTTLGRMVSIVGLGDPDAPG